MTPDRSLTGPVWEFPARLVRVIDGDTLELRFDLGFNITRRDRVRVFGVDTAETHNTAAGSDERQRGEIHTEFTRDWLVTAAKTDTDWPLEVRTLREPGKYGRWIADVIRRRDGESLTTALHRAFDDV